MPKPRIDYDNVVDPFEPKLVWEGEDGNTKYRLVVVYFVAGNAPAAMLEKCIGKDLLGQEKWDKTTVIPDCVLRDLAMYSSGEDDILKQPKVPHAS